VPSFLRATRRQIGRRALAGLICLVLAVAAVFAVRLHMAVGAGEPVVLAPSRSGLGLVGRSLPPGFTAASVTGPEGGAAASGDAPGSGGSASAGVGGSASAGGGGPPSIRVHVVGEVPRPGVVVLAPGSRVADAVAGAGGAHASADLERVNLARVVTDGEQIHVPAPGEALPPGSNGAGSGAGSSPGPHPTTAPPLVDLNSADLAALDTLPGVGPVLAQRIVDWRSERGRFTTVEELNEVSGIGDKLFAQLKPRVTV
jgi:competence protein ComEA